MRIRKADINGSAGWCVDYGMRDGKRRREYFIDYSKATKAFAAGQKDAKELGRSWANIQPHERLGVVAVLKEISTAGLTVREVWDSYRKGQHVSDAGRITIRKAIDKLLEAKQAAGLAVSSIANLRQVLNRWSSGQDHRSLASVTVDELEAFVARQSSAGSKATIINRLSSLFSFAVRKGWLPGNPCKRLERPRQDAKLPSVLSVADARKMLLHVLTEQRRLIPWLSLSLFCGLRPEEADKMTWDKINLDAGTLVVDPTITKVRYARTVHLEPAAVAWLKLGGDLPFPKVSRRRALRALRDYMDWDEWPKDVLRHTGASNLVALKKSYGAVALEMGHGEAVLRKNYRAEVSPADCAAFWSLLPATVKAAKKTKKSKAKK